MATMRTKWNCVCEERFVNYKAPDSISKYFYFETSSITSSRYLRGTVRYTVSSSDSNAAAGGISRSSRLLLQVEEVKPQEAGQPQRHDLGVGGGQCPLGALPGWWESAYQHPGLLVLRWDRAEVWHTLGHRSLGRCELWLPPEGTSTPLVAVFADLCLAFPPPSLLLAFPIEASTLQPLPQALLSGDMT